MRLSVKAGDLVRLKSLPEECGNVGLITRILHTSVNTGQIVFLANGTKRSVPWFRRDEFLEVISESR